MPGMMFQFVCRNWFKILLQVIEKWHLQSITGFTWSFLTPHSCLLVYAFWIYFNIVSGRSTHLASLSQGVPEYTTTFMSFAFKLWLQYLLYIVYIVILGKILLRTLALLYFFTVIDGFRISSRERFKSLQKKISIKMTSGSWTLAS